MVFIHTINGIDWFGCLAIMIKINIFKYLFIIYFLQIFFSFRKIIILSTKTLIPFIENLSGFCLIVFHMHVLETITLTKDYLNTICYMLERSSKAFITARPWIKMNRIQSLFIFNFTIKIHIIYIHFKY